MWTAEADGEMAAAETLPLPLTVAVSGALIDVFEAATVAVPCFHIEGRLH